MKKLLVILLASWASHSVAQDFDRVFVFLNKNPDKEQITEEAEEELINQHLANMGVLASEGKLINAGPFEGGGGIFVMNSASVDTVTHWIKTDPAIQANRWIIEMFPFTTTIGGSCTQEPPYEMVTYQFVRYTPSNQIANYKANGNVENGNAFNELIGELKRSDQLLMAGHFANNEGGVLVIKNQDGVGQVKGSKMHSNGYYELDFKELWIAKGSFCEN